jgi:hypothetical protein
MDSGLLLMNESTGTGLQDHPCYRFPGQPLNEIFPMFRENQILPQQLCQLIHLGRHGVDFVIQRAIVPIFQPSAIIDTGFSPGASCQHSHQVVISES